jgi:flagellar basal-body rod modification protein FlgD
MIPTTTAATQSPAGTIFPAQASLQSQESQLDMQDFLKLLTSQLQYQDPLEPVKDTEFVAQMASFSSLDQMSALNKNFESFMQGQMNHSVQNYLGKVVTIKGEDGTESAPGLVTAVSNKGGEMKLTIGEREYSSNSVMRVELPATEEETPEQSL